MPVENNRREKKRDRAHDCDCAFTFKLFCTVAEVYIIQYIFNMYYNKVIAFVRVRIVCSGVSRSGFIYLYSVYSYFNSFVVVFVALHSDVMHE